MGDRNLTKINKKEIKDGELTIRLLVLMSYIQVKRLH